VKTILEAPNGTMSEPTKEAPVGTPLMGINQEAPAVGRSEIEIAAPPEVVWEVLTEIEQWPSWNPDIKSMSMQGDLAEGSVFRWKAGFGTITSTIRRRSTAGSPTGSVT
jgi:hypothetical protein